MNWCKLQLRDSNGLDLFEGKVCELPLSEKNITALSIRFFNDPAPCYIHRSAVLSRVYNELNDYFEKCRQSGTISMECLPESLRAYFDAVGGAEEIVISNN